MIQTLASIPMNARDQGNRGSCVAFSIAGIKGCIANYLLSPEYAYLATVHQSPRWEPNQGLDVRIAIAATKAGLPEEHYFPYQNQEPSLPLRTLPVELPLFGPHMTLLAPNLTIIKQWVDAGRPVGVLIALTQSFMTPVDGIVRFEADVYPGQHAVVIAGYGIDQLGHEHFLICNSWGSRWGVQGHAWVPDSYLHLHASCIYGAN